MDGHNDTALKAPWSHATLPRLLQGQVRERPGGLLWADCPQRESWNGAEPRRLKAADALACTQFLAAQLVTLGLQRGDHVLILLPNLVEVPMAIIACQMAGAMPVVMPIDEKAEAIRVAAEKLGVVMILTTAMVKDLAVGEKARQVAAKVMTVRCVAGFGLDLPDGVVSLEGWSDDEVDPFEPALGLAQDPALVTFTRLDGMLVPAQRSHAQLVAEALAVLASLGGLDFGEVVSMMHPGSAATIAGSFGLGLVAGCGVLLIGPYERAVLQKRLQNADSPVLLAPAHFFTRGEAPHVRDLSHVTTIAFGRAQDEETQAALPAAVLGRLIAVDERAVLAVASDADLPAIVAGGQPCHPDTTVLPADKLWLVPAEGGHWKGFGAALLNPKGQTSSQAA